MSRFDCKIQLKCEDDISVGNEAETTENNDCHFFSEEYLKVSLVNVHVSQSNAEISKLYFSLVFSLLITHIVVTNYSFFIKTHDINSIPCRAVYIQNEV